MLIERMEYSDEPSLVADLDGSIFRYCLFKDIAVEGKSVDAVFLSCELNDLDWYWGLFNACLFVDTQLRNCVFRGTNFADCRFLNCKFINCRFEDDNLGSACSFEGTCWFESEVTGGGGLPDNARSVLARSK